MAIIRVPTAEEIKNLPKAMEPHLLALGKVANTWNLFQEDLARLYVIVTQKDDRTAYTEWHSIRNDRAQRDKLRSAIKTARGRWKDDKRLSTAADDLIWLLDQAEIVADQRNTAIHAPLIPSLGGGNGPEILPYYFFQNPRAENLKGKDILAEFTWYEKSAETLTSFARQAWNALQSDNNPWPVKSQMPTRDNP
jgi:hypothetical protein